MSRVKFDAEALNKQKQQKKEAAYQAAVSRVPVFTWCAVAAAVLALLLFFVSWAHIHNTDMNDGAGGWEVTFDGWASLAAGITRDFTSTGSVYKDLAVPFYYYAQGYVETLSTLTLAAFIAAAVSLALGIVSALKKRHGHTLAAAIAGAVSGALLIACYVEALAMSGSDILPLYCSYNPACSIRSQAVIPAVCMLGSAALYAVGAVQYKKAKALLK